MESLESLVAHLRGVTLIQPGSADALPRPKNDAAKIGPDLLHVKGQEHAKRALEVAAAGGHNLVMIGPPGSGKTLLARTLPSILPAMESEEALEVTKIYSISGLLPPDQPLARERSFRSPYYTTSHVGLVGGGRTPRAGEITLSHRGVLFLDELPEFTHISLEALRQPLEDHVVTISRAQWNATFPCNLMLVAAMNPCPCGFYGDPKKACGCSAVQVSRYQRRISGPLMDTDAGESSASVRQRVEEAREVQRQRFRGMPQLANAEMGPAEVGTTAEWTREPRGCSKPP